MAPDADVEQWTLLALAIIMIVIRMYVRWSLVGPRDFQLDDYLMPIAGVSQFLRVQSETEGESEC
jgi:hypothetical protein